MTHLSLPALFLGCFFASIASSQQSQQPFAGQRHGIVGGSARIGLDDVDGDGNLDLVCAGDALEESGAAVRFLSVLNGTGKGTFLAPTQIPVAFDVSQIELEDLNNDGKRDVVALTWPDYSVAVMLADGAGSFLTPVIHPTSAPTTVLAGYVSRKVGFDIADLDGDGDLDVVVPVRSVGTFVLLGDGLGGFGNASLVTPPGPSGSDFGAATLFDHDGDGNLDVAIEASRLLVRYGDGAGGFGPEIVFQVGPALIQLGSNLIAHDFDGDGWDDLAFHEWLSRELHVLVNDQAGGFLAPVVAQGPMLALGRLAHLDFDSDGVRDIVFFEVSGGLGFFKGRGGVVFDPFVPSHADIGLSDLALGDFDGDQVQDLALAFADGPVAYRADSQGGFSLPGALSALGPSGVASGDWNGDGWGDYAFTTGSIYDPRIVYGSPNGFGPEVNTWANLGGATSLTAADIDLDGDLDLVMTRDLFNTSTDIVSVIKNNGGNFGLLQSVLIGDSDPQDSVVTEFTGDGLPDLATANAEGSVTLLRGTGFGKLELYAHFYGVGTGAESIAAGDPDGDGLVDLAVVARGSKSLRIVKHVGPAQFVTVSLGSLPNEPRQVEFADLNADGLDDLIVGMDRSGTESSIRWMLADGQGGFAPPSSLSWVGEFGSFVVDDFDGDARLDLIGSNGLFARGDGAGGLAIKRISGGLRSVAKITSGDIDGDGARDVFATTLTHIQYVHNEGPGCAFERYCSAKVNSLGCTPRIRGLGVSSATAASGFFVIGQGVRNNKSGLLLYGLSGPASLPFSGGFLCVAPGVKRTPGLNAGGNAAPANDCSGVFSLDMNAFAQGLAGGVPDPLLREPGSVVHAQYWSRDQGFAAPNNIGLTDGLRYTICQ